MTQGVYRTPRCPLKTDTSGFLRGALIDSGSPFERELIKYLRAYRLRCIYEVISKLRLYDWSSCRVRVISFNLFLLIIYKGYFDWICAWIS
jgi:hypothetical protein